MWSALMAQDAVIVEEHPKAGSLIVEWDRTEKDLDILRRIPGVAAIRVLPKLETAPPIFQRRAA